MKRTYSFNIICLFFLITSLCGCMNDSYDDCELNVHFNYSYNLLNSNVIGEQANHTALYAFDESGILRYYKEEYFDKISNSYKMNIDDLPSGQYEFVGLAESTSLKDSENSFYVPNLHIDRSTIEDLYAQISTDNKGVSKYKQNNFLLGNRELAEVKSYGELTVDLKKVTNTVRVVLVSNETKPMTQDRYIFSIEDIEGNGVINYDYNIRPSQSLMYKPYYQGVEIPSINDDPDQEYDECLASQFSMSRLMADHDTHLTVIESSTGRKIISVNILPLIKMAQMKESQEELSFQEYLDRNDNFSITLFVDKNAAWVTGYLIVNGWRIINEDISV